MTYKINYRHGETVYVSFAEMTQQFETLRDIIDSVIYFATNGTAHYLYHR